MDIQRVGVVGAGAMGNGIAHVFARSGFNVLLCDVEQSFLDRALATISKNLDREAAKGKISAEAQSGGTAAHRALGGPHPAGGLRLRGGSGYRKIRNQGRAFSGTR